ncbi:MAG: NfeD family protein [Ruminococcus sp.]
MTFIWLGLAVLLAVVEICTTQLVSVWFVAGALVTAVCSATFLEDKLLWQIVVFIVVSALALILTRPLVKRMKGFAVTKTNSDRHIGKKALVISDVDNEKGTGLVEVEGSKWTAKSRDGEIIEVGNTVRIEAIEGVKLIVTPCDKEIKESECI